GFSRAVTGVESWASAPEGTRISSQNRSPSVAKAITVTAFFYGAASEAAEKRHLPCVLKGRTFRCAVQVLSSCHSEWASAHEESAFRTFSAASSAAEGLRRDLSGVDPERRVNTILLVRLWPAAVQWADSQNLGGTV